MKFAEKVLPILFTVLYSIAAADIFPAEELKSNIQESRIYIDSARVLIDNTGIQVFLNQNWQTTNAIFSDANGLYIIDSKGGWTCGRCGHYNTTNLWTCDRCNTRRDGSLKEN